MRPLLTLYETAVLLQIPEKSLYAQRSRGAAPGALGVKVGRHVRFRPEDLEAWLDAQQSEKGT
jgi:predicted DNA-binding transcriptional regulator AlpA